MTKTTMHIEIVSSTIPGLSSMSEPSRNAIQRTLRQHYTNVSVTIINTVADLEALVARRPDLVFLGMQFLATNPAVDIKESPKIWMTKYLEDAAIAFTGSRQSAHKLERRKPMAKRCIENAGIKTSAFMVIRKNVIVSQQDVTLAYPLFVKPTSSGGGTGVDEKSLVHTITELRSKVASIAAEHDSDSLVETYLPGREFSVAILADEHTDSPYVMPIELVAGADENGTQVLSQEVKSLNAEVVSGVADGLLRDGVVDLALRAYRALGARDYGRIDIRLDANGEPNFLEANLIPSLIEGYGSFPKACLINQSMNYETMLLHIVKLALLRRTGVELPFRVEQTVLA